MRWSRLDIVMENTGSCGCQKWKCLHSVHQEGHEDQEEVKADLIILNISEARNAQALDCVLQEAFLRSGRPCEKSRPSLKIDMNWLKSARSPKIAGRLEGPFSAVSKPMFASEFLFAVGLHWISTKFQTLHDLRTSAPLRTQNVFKTFFRKTKFC